MKKLFCLLVVFGIILSTLFGCMPGKNNAIIPNSSGNSAQSGEENKYKKADKTGKYVTLPNFSRVAFAIDMDNGLQIFACDANGECDHQLNTSQCMFKNNAAELTDCTDDYIAFSAENLSKDNRETAVYIYDMSTKETTRIFGAKGINIPYLKCVGDNVFFGIGSGGTISGNISVIWCYNRNTKELKNIFNAAENMGIEFLTPDLSMDESVYRAFDNGKMKYYLTNEGKYDKSRIVFCPESEEFTYTDNGYFFKSSKQAAIADFITGRIIEMPTENPVTHIIKSGEEYCFMERDESGINIQGKMTGSSEKGDYFKDTIFITNLNGIYKKYEIHSDFYGIPEAVYKNNVLLKLWLFRDIDTVRDASENGYGYMWINLETGEAVIYKNVDTETETVTVAERTTVRVDKLNG